MAYNYISITKYTHHRFLPLRKRCSVLHRNDINIMLYIPFHQFMYVCRGIVWVLAQVPSDSKHACLNTKIKIYHLLVYPDQYPCTHSPMRTQAAC
jgi:hypothetical protein